MFKYLMKLLLDEHGTWAAVAVGGGLAVGGAALGAWLGKNKQKTIDPYAQLRGKYQSYLGDRLGKQTPYEYNDAFAWISLTSKSRWSRRFLVNSAICQS